MDNKTDRQELISALADGQLQGEALARAVTAACSDAEGRAAWQTYHAIGDVLRSSELAACSPADRFVARLNERLRSEPRAVAPVALMPPIVARPAANDADFRWKLAAGFASVAAVAAIGWNLAAPSASLQPQLAAAPVAVVPVASASNERQAMIRDPHLDRLLAAHRQLGAATALQQPAGFLRNATFEGPAR